MDSRLQEIADYLNGHRLMKKSDVDRLPQLAAFLIDDVVPALAKLATIEEAEKDQAFTAAAGKKGRAE